MHAAKSLVIAAIFLSGCSASSDQSDQSTIQQRQDKALADPMHYSVDMTNTDINTGGIGSYDDKAMKRDLDSALNP